MFITAGQNVMDKDTMIRIYIDGEQDASIEFELFLAHGVGTYSSDEQNTIPWGTKRIGHAAMGGIHDTFRIPFSKSAKVTATHPKGGTFWYIIRGVYNYPVILGDLILPASTRLRLYKNTDVLLNPLQFITLADVNNTAGALFLVTLAASSKDYNYLEACFRAQIDGEADTTWLSSGTEDFFLSAYYFNRGYYHFENAGLTLKMSPGIVSAYKFFENDPMLFTSSFKLMWRCGETRDGKDGCPSDFPPGKTHERRGEDVKSPLLSNTTVSTYTWIYQWTQD